MFLFLFQSELPAVFQIHTGTGQDGSTTVHAVQALSEVTHGEGGNMSVDLSSVTEATLGQDGQLILTGEDGHGRICIIKLEQ
jgi:nuclear respiratory factor 1